MRFTTALLTLVALGPCAALPAQSYTDPHGFKIKLPSGWSYLGQGKDLGQNGPVFAASRVYAPKKGGIPHTPTFRVLFFEKGADGQPAESEGLPKRTPYRSYADYLARVYGTGAEETSAEVEKMGAFDGIVSVAEIKRPGGDLALHAFRLERDGGDLVLEFELLSEQHGKLKRQLDKAFKSLKEAPAEKAPAAPAAPPWDTDYAAWRELPADERAKKRKEYGDAWLASRPKIDEKGWTTLEIDDDYVVESRADKKFAKRTAEAAKAFREWLDGRFANVSDEVVMPAAIRIYDDSRELSALRQREVNTRPYDPDRREIYYYEDDRFGTSGEGYGVLMRGMLEHYLHDKHPEIVRHIPRWLDFGMSEYFRSSRYKKKKLEFFSSTEENTRMVNYERMNIVFPNIWGLTMQTLQPSPKNGEPEEPWNYVTDCARAIRWFDAGGSKLLGHEDFLVAYYQAIAKCADKLPDDPAKDVEWARLRDNQVIQLRKDQYAWRDNFLIEVNGIATNLTDAAWEKANASWKKFNEDFKQ